MHNETERMIRQVTRRYSRRVVRVDSAELYQVAWIAVEESRASFDAGRGTPFHAYAYRAVVRAIVAFLWRTGSPVSEAEKRLPDLAHASAAPIDNETPEEPTENAEHGVWRAHVRAEIAELAASIKDGGAALRCLIDEVPATQAAQEARIPLPRVYKATHALRRAVRHSETICQLWQEGS